MTPLCSGSQGFPGPFSPEKHPSFQRHHGQFVNILLSLRARRNQVLQSSAQHNRHSAPLLRRCSRCIFLGIALLTKRTRRSPGARANTHCCPCDSPLAPVKPGPDSPWREAKRVSCMELHRADFGGAWVQTLPPLVGFIVSLYKKDCVKYRQRQCHSWIDYPLGTPESCVLSAAPPAPDSTPWSGHFISRRL